MCFLDHCICNKLKTEKGEPKINNGKNFRGVVVHTKKGISELNQRVVIWKKKLLPQRRIQRASL